MTTVDVAITTWNRRETVVRAIESALAQDVEGMQVVVYDNASTDGTPGLCHELFGDRIVYRRWEENRGRHLNMTRAFTESTADYIIMLFDDEELLPGGLAALMKRASEDPSAAFVGGRFLYRNATNTTVRDSSLQAPDSFRPPAFSTGDDFIRSAYTAGLWTWICSVMFNRNVIGTARIRERDDPCDDAGLQLRAALHGPVLYLDQATTTKTDGNDGESIRIGLTEAQTLDDRNVIRLSGIIGLRHTLEKFLYFDAFDHFTARQRRSMLDELDVFCASLMSDRLADVRLVTNDRQTMQRERREALGLLTTMRGRAHLLKRIARSRT